MASPKMSGLGMTLQTPPPLTAPQIDDGDDRHHTLTRLDESDERFQEISTDFKNAGMTVTQVEMLKNGVLWKRYATERDLILEQREKTDSNFKLNERYLYHGTSVKKSYICDEGLDSRMSNEGCFGKGIYFSDFPKKCIKYASRGARKGTSDESYILLVRVILGVAKVYPKGQKARALKREPEKEEPYTGHRFYDSVEGCPVNHKEFVVYDSRRALVEGIITFSAEKKEKKEKKTHKSPNSVATKSDLNDMNNLNDNVSDSDNDAVNEKDDEADCSGASSSEGEIGDDGEVSDSDSNKSDESSNTSDSEAEHHSDHTTEDDLAQLLVQKERQFSDATGVTEDFYIQYYLLQGGMNVQRAVKIYEEKKAAGFPDSEFEDDDDDDDDDVVIQEPPLPDTEAWDNLTKENRDAIIETLIDDFLLITALDVDERDLARKYLSAVNYHLDHALVAYYEE